MPSDHIVPLGKDNFWGPAGEYGPCGPCTEVFFDTGDEFGPAYVPGGHFDDVNRYIEIWNAGVFMEFNKLPAGFSRLEMRSVDTGTGCRRLSLPTLWCRRMYKVRRPAAGESCWPAGPGAAATVSWNNGRSVTQPGRPSGNCRTTSARARRAVATSQARWAA